MDYDNLPWKRGMLLVNQLPENHRACASSRGTIHIVRGWDNFDFDDRKKVMAICSNWTEYENTDMKVPRHWVCETCLKSLNNYMEGFMFDSKNEQYYDPTS